MVTFYDTPKKKSEKGGKKYQKVLAGTPASKERGDEVKSGRSSGGGAPSPAGGGAERSRRKGRGDPRRSPRVRSPRSGERVTAFTYV